MAQRYASLFERLIANSEPAPGQNENGCWMWTGKTDGKRWPYGTLNVRVSGQHRTLRAHRAMAKVFEGELGPEQTVDHLCGVYLCVNPDHFDIVTRVENSKRSQEVNPRLPPRFTRTLANATVQAPINELEPT